MNDIMKRIITGICMAAALLSCEREESQVYHLELESTECEVAPVKGSFKMTVFGEGSWYVKSDADWCTLYPSVGKDDGRFYINASDWERGYSRACKVVVTLQDSTKYEISVTQKGQTPYLSVKDERLSFPSEPTGGIISVNSNVEWTAEVSGEGSGWLTLGEKTDDSQALSINGNEDPLRRSATVTFRENGGDLACEVAIIQFPVLDKGKALVKTIKDVLAENDGLIGDNIKVEGYVTSDRMCGNTGGAEMYLQDDSGKGILFEFSDPARNIYSVNDKIGVWLAACEIRKVDGVTKISNITDANLVESTSLSGNGATPVEISDISQMDQDEMENTLVTLKNVCFTYPFGTLYNSNKETGNDCVTLLRDSKGNNMDLRTMTTFKEKHARLIPSGNCDVTGILMKHDGRLVLRVRSFDDIAESAVPSVWRTVVEWYNVGSWTNTVGGTSWAPKVGSGAFVFGTFGDLKQGWCYDRIDPTQKNSAKNGHHGPQLNHWWDTGSGTGQSWEFSTSTAVCTGDIWMSLYTGSSNDGPKNFVVEWTDSEAVDAVWNKAGSYLCWSWGDTGSDHSNILMNVDMKLAGAQGHQLLRVRLRCADSERAQSNASNPLITTSGSNKLCYVRISERTM